MGSVSHSRVPFADARGTSYVPGTGNSVVSKTAEFLLSGSLLVGDRTQASKPTNKNTVGSGKYSGQAGFEGLDRGLRAACLCEHTLPMSPWDRIGVSFISVTLTMLSVTSSV